MGNAKTVREWVTLCERIGQRLYKELQDLRSTLILLDDEKLPPKWNECQGSVESDLRLQLVTAYLADDVQFCRQELQDRKKAVQERKRLLEELRLRIRRQGLLTRIFKTGVDADNLAVLAGRLAEAQVLEQVALRDCTTLDAEVTQYSYSLQPGTEPMRSMLADRQLKMTHQHVKALKSLESRKRESRERYDALEIQFNELESEYQFLEVLAEQRPTLMLDEDTNQPGWPLVPPDIRRLIAIGSTANRSEPMSGATGTGDAGAGAASQAPNKPEPDPDLELRRPRG